MKPRGWVALAVLPLLISLAGCGYSGGGPDPAARAQSVAAVQRAVDQYKQITGYPPIKNKEEDTPVYEKYLIDFAKLENYSLIDAPPANAYEKGGADVYVLVHVETQPQVKLMDMHSFQKMADLQRDVDDYIRTHRGEVPETAALSADFAFLDASKFPKKETEIYSPYSQRLLSVVIDSSGRIALDYTADLITALSSQGIEQPDPNIDLREILVDQSYYVPAWSYPYYWRENQITLADK